jgi:hypothetical protein
LDAQSSSRRKRHLHRDRFVASLIGSEIHESCFPALESDGLRNDSVRQDRNGNGIDGSTTGRSSLSDRQIDVESVIRVYHYGRREFTIKDPNGYVLALSESTSDPPTC